jgi:hypothetical protein
MFTATSRYQGIPTATFQFPDGRVVLYVRRRFLPDPASLTRISVHMITTGERLDLIAAEELGDAEQAWRIADAHRVLDPAILTATPGRRLRITLPAGLPQGAGVLATPAGDGG